MDGSIFFVHGTGNWDGRKPGVNAQLATTLDAIRRGLAKSKMSTITVDGPTWARDVAPDWPDISRVLPPALVTKAIGDDVEPADDADYWELLLQDPLIELRLTGLGAVAESAPVIGGLLPAQTISDLTRGLALADADLASFQQELHEVCAELARAPRPKKAQRQFSCAARSNASPPEFPAR